MRLTFQEMARTTGQKGVSIQGCFVAGIGNFPHGVNPQTVGQIKRSRNPPFVADRRRPFHLKSDKRALKIRFYNSSSPQFLAGIQ